MSEDQAVRRISAARLARRFPVILEALRAGRIHVSSIFSMRQLFTQENVEALVDEAAGMSKRQVEELVAKLAPRPDKPSSIRELRERRLGPQMKPLSPLRHLVQFTASAELREKIERIQALMRHTNPDGDLAVIIEQALDLLLAKLERRKLGKTEAPRTPQPRHESDPADVSQAVRREVAARDGMQCAFVSDDGKRCESRDFLEVDHVRPRVVGGTGDAANTRVLCAQHNRFEAERFFGRQHVEASIDAQRARRAPEAPDIAVRGQVHGALVHLGFREPDAKRALARLDPATFTLPVEEVLREALRVLTP